MNHFKNLSLVVATCCLLFFSTSCNQSQGDFEQEKALELIDSLYNSLNQVKSKLNQIDLADIKERKELIEQDLLVVSTYGDTVLINSEMLKVLEEYRALSKIYKNCLKSTKTVVMETEELHVQLKTLRESMSHKQYDKEEFKTYLNKEKEDIEKLLEYTKIYLDPVIETENLFIKRAESVGILIQKIKAKNNLE